jgi:hypothetical protein
LLAKLEDEALEQHRIAKQRKLLNLDYDRREAEQQARKARLNEEYGESIREQLRNNTHVKIMD